MSGDDFEEGSEEYSPGGPKVDAPNKVADKIMAEVELLTDLTGTTYRYTGTHWVEASKVWLFNRAFLADGRFRTSRRRREEIVNYIQHGTVEPRLQWSRVADHEIPCLNGVLSSRSRTLRPHRAEDYLERVIPWEWLPFAPCPVWHKALDTWFGDDETAGQTIAALQEFFGYVLLPHARFKRALIVQGGSNTGKSRIPATLMAMVGKEATCSLSVEHMDDPQRCSVLIGKALNVATDLTTEALIADGGFKTLISTEEPILIDAKYRAALMYAPTAKHCFACNTLPRMTDRSEGIFNRLLLIPMPRVLRDDEQDRDLDARLLEEMPGIVAWAVEGAARLVARNGHWDLPASTVQALQRYREEWNAAVAFVAECMSPAIVDEKGKTSAVPISTLTGHFNRWSQGGQRLRPRQLANDLRRAGHTLRRVRFGERVAMSLLGFDWLGLPQEGPALLVNAVDAGASVDETISGDPDLT